MAPTSERGMIHSMQCLSLYDIERQLEAHLERCCAAALSPNWLPGLSLEFRLSRFSNLALLIEPSPDPSFSG